MLEADGTVSVFTQQMPHGQGHETTLAQVAADELGVPIEQVRVRYGDTGITPFGLAGTGGSRSAPMAGGAVTYSARAFREQILDVAADLLEAAARGPRHRRGRDARAGCRRSSVSFAEVVAKRASTARRQLRGDSEYDGGEGGWAQATHVCWVEVDLNTGRVQDHRYVAVEDCGELINPAVVDGQISGGVVQGIGAVLYEKSVYDDKANFQAGTFMDYLLPTATEVPDIEIHHVETPTDIEINYRGVGEGGMIVAPAALTNAIEDALAHLGVPHHRAAPSADPHPGARGRDPAGVTGRAVSAPMSSRHDGRPIPMDATNLADLYGTPLLDWDRIVDRLDEGVTQAPGTGGPDRHTCWLATMNADGSPHVTGIGALWLDGAFWFETGERTRKGRNLARDPRCTLSVASHEFDLVVEGEAHVVTEPAIVADMARRWADEGWPARVDESGTAITAEYSAPSAGPPPWLVYRMAPRTATGLLTVDPGGATRWRF